MKNDMRLNTIFTDVRMTLLIGGREVDAVEFYLRPTKTGFFGSWEGHELTVCLEQINGYPAFSATLRREGGVDCRWIKTELRYPCDRPERCLVPGGGSSVGIAGLHRLTEKPTAEDSRFCGVFRSSTEPCLLLATVNPQQNRHLYQASVSNAQEVCLTAKTYFTSGQATLNRVTTEKTMVLHGLTPLAAMEAYAAHVPQLPKTAEPLVGWSTWDYYFTAIEPSDLTENLQAIAADPELSQQMKCFLVDDGWQHREGEWFANYRFPQGTAGIAEEIGKYGLVPGIWTNGCQVWPLTHTALRHPEVLLKDTDGNVIMVDGLCLMDPTHPSGEQYIFDTYRRLYNDGFRIFKVDFVSCLTAGDNFYDKTCGPYEAIRRLFAVIRRAVGGDSHILGCSYPAECGAGFVDSCRISVDIHNYWSHVRWVMDYWQMRFWENGRLYRVDPDYLVVRGSETSTEAETNVTNFAPNAPYAENAPGNRWRRGPVFDALEAETWANITRFAGGNVVSSDRLTALNEKGMALLKRHLTPGIGAVPLDLGDDTHAAFWLERQTGSLLVINHAEEARELVFEFARFGLPAPTVVACGKPCSYDGKRLIITLRRHESAVAVFQSE